MSYKSVYVALAFMVFSAGALLMGVLLVRSSQETTNKTNSIIDKNNPSDKVSNRPSIIVKKAEQSIKQGVGNRESMKQVIESLIAQYSLPFYSNDSKRDTTVVIPQQLNVIVGFDNRNYKARMNAVENLSKSLTAEEIEALLCFLRKSIFDDDLKAEQLNAIKNDVFIKLMQQNSKVEDLAEHLVVMYFNKSADVIWKEYCVQFIGDIYPLADSEERGFLEYCIEDALKDKTNLASTALVAMTRIVDISDYNRRDIAEKAFEICSDDDTADHVRMTALQICSEYEHPQAIDVARKIEKSSRNVMLKMAAIATIGASGDSSDLPVLEKYTKSSDTRLRFAAKAAVKKLGTVIRLQSLK